MRDIKTLQPNECIEVHKKKDLIALLKLTAYPFEPEHRKPTYMRKKGSDGWEFSNKPNVLCKVILPASDFLPKRKSLRKEVKALKADLADLRQLVAKGCDVVQTEMKGSNELPDNWCVKITKENKSILHQWRIKELGSNDYSTEAICWYLSRFGIAYSYKEGYTEISFADFKRLVLKDEQPPKKPNGWYTLGKALVYVNNNRVVYGFDDEGNWVEESTSLRGDEIPALESFVKERLIKEAEKRGFKEGVKYKSCTDGEVHTVQKSLEFFNDTQNITYRCGGSVYLNGKWATIVEQAAEIDWNLSGQLITSNTNYVWLTTGKHDKETFEAVAIQCKNGKNICIQDLWIDKTDKRLCEKPVTLCNQ